MSEHRRHICDADDLENTCSEDYCDVCLKDWPCPGVCGGGASR